MPRVCGGSDLKASQHYPRLFGHAVAQLYHRHEQDVRGEVKQRAPLGNHLHRFMILFVGSEEPMICLHRVATSI